MEPLRALVADDHELFLAGLSAMLRREFGFADVVEASSLDDAVAHLGKASFAFASFDLSMPGMHGISSLRGLRAAFPDMRIAVITASARREDMLQALAAGIHGYVPKTLRLREILQALRLVLEGQIYVPPCLAEATPEPQAYQRPLPSLGAVELTARQSEVLRLIADGKSNKEIAQALGLADGTVKVHIQALFRVLGVDNRVSAAAMVSALDLKQKD